MSFPGRRAHGLGPFHVGSPRNPLESTRVRGQCSAVCRPGSEVFAQLRSTAVDWRRMKRIAHASLLLSAFLFCLPLVSCSSGSGSGSASAGLVETCSGQYTCTDGYDDVSSTLEQHDGACYVGSIRIDPDGTASYDNTVLTWSGDVNAFSLCQDSDCLTCTADNPSAASSTKPAAKSCQGSPDSCPSYPPCADVRGCYMHVHYDAFGHPDNTCEGYPDSCESMGDEESCIEQGCQWM